MEIIHINKKTFDSIPDGYKSTYMDTDGVFPERVGRRVAFLPGHGTTLLTEGIHFLVDDDPSHLPVLCKTNAEVGAAYQFAGGVMFVRRVYRLSEQEAKEQGVLYLDRVETSAGDFALSDSDLTNKFELNADAPARTERT